MKFTQWDGNVTETSSKGAREELVIPDEVIKKEDWGSGESDNSPIHFKLKEVVC